MKKSKSKLKNVIGWREWVSLPDLKIPEIKAKIDTGARSSALHAFDVKKFRRGGKQMVRFKVYPYQRSTSDTISAESEMIGERHVRSSIGREELRPVIRTSISLFDRTWNIELTLTNRVQMGFRMLLGREAIRTLFLIDPGLSYLANRAGKAAVLEAKNKKKGAP